MKLQVFEVVFVAHIKGSSLLLQKFGTIEITYVFCSVFYFRCIEQFWFLGGYHSCPLKNVFYRRPPLFLLPFENVFSKLVSVLDNYLPTLLRIWYRISGDVVLNSVCASFQYKHSYCDNACQRHFCPSPNNWADFVTHFGRSGITWNDFRWIWPTQLSSWQETGSICPWHLVQGKGYL